MMAPCSKSIEYLGNILTPTIV